MNILLTGATGFLGSRVLAKLLESGDTVHSMGRRQVRFEHPALYQWAADLTGAFVPPPLPWREIDRVVHLAASGVKASHRKWDDARSVNVQGTAALLSAIETFAIQRPPLLITRTFYEDLLESFPSLAANPYVATKAEGARLVREWAASSDWPVTFATVFQIFGGGDDPGNVLSYAAARIAAGKSATFSSGCGLRDWLHSSDAVDALFLLISSGISGSFDIGSGELRSVRQMVEAIARLAGASPNLLTFDPSLDRGDANFAHCAKTLPPGWSPCVPLNVGLSELLNSFHCFTPSTKL